MKIEGKREGTITRRSFVSAAIAVGATAIGASSALTGCAPRSAAAEASDANAATDPGSADASGRSWLGAEPEIADADVAEELSADVVIIGCSDSGAIAARAAVEAGASVIVIEKAAGVTGCGSDISVANGDLQARYGRDGAVGVDELVQTHQAECMYHSKEPIMRRYCEEMKDVFAWILEADPDLYIADTVFDDIPDEYAKNFLIPKHFPLPDESYDFRSEAMPTFPTTVKIPPLSTVLACNFDKASAEGNVTSRFGHAGAKLIMEDGRCTGAYALNLSTGTYLKANAAKGVILCTGDYKDDEAMLRAFAPEVVENGNTVLSTIADINGEKCCTGDGHKMGVWAGARMQAHHAPMIHHMGGGAGADGRGVMGINGYLQLDLDGKRFMNEDIPGQQLENQIEHLRGMTSYQFFDSAWPEQCKYFPTAHGIVSYCLETEPLNHPTNTNWRTLKDIEDAVADGRALRADSLDQLIAMVEDIDREAALASIERYNELARSGVDGNFGKDARRLFALENPPYYAVKFTPASILACLGGLESDENCHTFDENRAIIPGLYAAGNVQGDRFAGQYPISMAGCSVGLALFYGYVAGSNAAVGA